ncbi:hypothetical protein EYF80_027735 [Liparis tanakae]|uniref:Uncharacterized protein n=1 Tax=Liparis tanakae TaxID=230148 RepID=A0A4Z2HB02_9TELE|nr:hypothetical protein EYF80_027735 [Liparis tanakae]
MAMHGWAELAWIREVETGEVKEQEEEEEEEERGEGGKCHKNQGAAARPSRRITAAVKSWHLKKTIEQAPSPQKDEREAEEQIRKRRAMKESTIWGVWFSFPSFTMSVCMERQS